MKNKGMSLYPKSKPSSSSVDEFIMQGESHKTSGAKNSISQKIQLPWENKFVRSDLKKSFLLRINETDYIKIQYLSELKKCSMHKLIMDLVIPEVNNLLDIK